MTNVVFLIFRVYPPFCPSNVVAPILGSPVQSLKVLGQGPQESTALRLGEGNALHALAVIRGPIPNVQLLVVTVPGDQVELLGVTAGPCAQDSQVLHDGIGDFAFVHVQSFLPVWPVAQPSCVKNDHKTLDFLLFPSIMK